MHIVNILTPRSPAWKRKQKHQKGAVCFLPGHPTVLSSFLPTCRLSCRSSCVGFTSASALLHSSPTLSRVSGPSVLHSPESLTWCLLISSFSHHNLNLQISLTLKTNKHFLGLTYYFLSGADFFKNLSTFPITTSSLPFSSSIHWIHPITWVKLLSPSPAGTFC